MNEVIPMQCAEVQSSTQADYLVSCRLFDSIIHCSIDNKLCYQISIQYQIYERYNSYGNKVNISYLWNAKRRQIYECEVI